MKAKWISIPLALSILLSTAACSGGTAPADTTAGTPDTTAADTTTAETTTTGPVYTAPEVKNLDGYAFRMLAARTLPDGPLWVEESTGDTMNDAIYDRNRAVEEAYNVTMSLINNTSITGDVQKNVQAGDDFADLTFVPVRNVFPLIQAGNMHDLYATDSLRLDQPWWDQEVPNHFEFGGKLYLAEGDISLTDELYTFALTFNKELLKDLKLEDPYQLVRDGKWTYDKFWSMVTAASHDVNGDGTMTDADRFGFLTEYSSLAYMYAGGGVQPIRPDGKGGFEITLGTERSLNLVEKIVSIGTEKNKHTLIADDGNFSATYEGARTLFKSGQGLFIATLLNSVVKLRDSEVEFGVIPIPKFEEEQDKYCCIVTWNEMPMTIPITVKNLDNTALIAEAMSYESFVNVKDKFYDVFLDYKTVRDPESIEMLDIVFESKTYDLDWYAGITGFSDILANIGKTGNNNFVSEFASIKNSTQLKLDDFLAAFED